MTGVLRTDQVVPHADLVKVVQHHQQNLWRKPCPQHTQVAFEQFLARYQRQPRPLILDSYCGTGMSTALLAEKHPDKWVVGIDQSAHRLTKHPHSAAGNCLLLRAEAESFWRCLTEAGIQVSESARADNFNTDNAVDYLKTLLGSLTNLFGKGLFVLFSFVLVVLFVCLPRLLRIDLVFFCLVIDFQL